MIIDLENLKKIELCYENCEVNTIYYSNLLGIYMEEKAKFDLGLSDKDSYGIKTFEIALKDTNEVLKETGMTLRTDLAQLRLHYTDGTFEDLYIEWGQEDCTWSESSLQKVHIKDGLMSLTSNCEPMFL